MALRYFKGLLANPQTRTQTTTDQAGNYQLTHVFVSDCPPQDHLTDWIEASADGYETASTFVIPEFSDPVIHCTSDPQTINLTLHPFGSLQMITSTGGTGLDPDGYTLVLFGKVGSPGGLGYTMGLNDEQLIQLLPGQYSLELTEVAGNCTVSGDNPRPVTVAARNATVTTFQVTCAT